MNTTPVHHLRLESIILPLPSKPFLNRVSVRGLPEGMYTMEMFLQHLLSSTDKLQCSHKV